MRFNKWSAAPLVFMFAERLLVLFLSIILLFSDNVEPQRILGVTSLFSERVTLMSAMMLISLVFAWSLAFPRKLITLDGSRGIGQVLGACLRGLVFVLGLFSFTAWHLHPEIGVPNAILRFALFAVVLLNARLAITWLVQNTPWSAHHNVIILGTGPMARKVWREIRTSHHTSLRVSGFVDDLCLESALPEMKAKYLGPVDALESIFLRKVVDLVIVAIPAKSCYEAIQKTIRVSESVGVDVLQVDDVFIRRQNNLSSEMEAVKAITYSLHEIDRLGHRMIKRVFDIAVSATLLVLLVPLFLAIAVAIKVTDPGPALFIQERFGFRRRRFHLFKFRTMVVNAEKLMAELETKNEAVGPIFKIKADPRVTRLGRFLRASSLDELPQLWNVLRGDMSLVGPRPMSVRDVSLFSSAYLMRRFRVKPGITGLWQVSGRSNTTFDQWIALDFRYIDHWSLMLDLRILLRTIPAVFRGAGAM